MVEYWWGSSLTLARALRSASGGSKSGNPWERLTALAWVAIRVILRMMDSVKPVVLLLSFFMVAPCCVFMLWGGVPVGSIRLSLLYYTHPL